MPKIADVERAHAEALEVAAPAAAPAAPVYPAHEHVTADHMTFINADGTYSRICICCCDTCWPPGVKEPGPCPDWS